MNNKIISALCYLVFFAPKFLGKENDHLVNYHMKQGLGLLIFALAGQGILSIIGYWGFYGLVFVLVWALRLVLLLFVMTGWMNSMAGKNSPLPLIGKYSEKAF